MDALRIFLAFFLALFACAIYRHLSLGKVESYYGDAFSPSREDDSVSYWIVIFIEVGFLLFGIWAVLP